MCGFWRSGEWKNWVGLMAGCDIGVVDECMKTLPPGREFSTGDMVRDFVGVVVAVVVSIAVGKIKCRGETNHG